MLFEKNKKILNDCRAAEAGSAGSRVSILQDYDHYLNGDGVAEHFSVSRFKDASDKIAKALEGSYSPAGTSSQKNALGSLAEQVDHRVTAIDEATLTIMSLRAGLLLRYKRIDPRRQPFGPPSNRQRNPCDRPYLEAMKVMKKQNDLSVQAAADFVAHAEALRVRFLGWTGTIKGRATSLGKAGSR